MIVVTVEMWPGGRKRDKRMLGRALIANDGTGSDNTGNYSYKLYDKAGRKYKSGKVVGFRRKAQIAWRLLYLVLKDAFDG